MELIWIEVTGLPKYLHGTLIVAEVSRDAHAVGGRSFPTRPYQLLRGSQRLGGPASPSITGGPKKRRENIGSAGGQFNDQPFGRISSWNGG